MKRTSREEEIILRYLVTSTLNSVKESVLGTVKRGFHETVPYKSTVRDDVEFYIFCRARNIGSIIIKDELSHKSIYLS